MSFLSRFRIPQRWEKFIPIILALLLLFLTYLFGVEIGAFSGFPKGYDAYGHMGLARIFRDSFPHIYWNPYWNSGTTLLIRSYPPMTYLLGALISRVFTMSLEGAFIILASLSILLTVFGVFSFVFLLTRKTIASLLSSLLLIGSSAFWAYMIEGGLYPRVFGAAPLVLSLIFVWLYLEKGKDWGFWYYLSILFLFFSFMFHQLSALWASLAVVFFIGLYAKTRIEILAKIVRLLGPVFLLGAFYYLPLLFVLGKNPPTLGKFPDQPNYTLVSLAHLFRPETTIASVPILLIPLAIIVVFLRFGQKIEPGILQKTALISRILALFAIIALAYALGIFGVYLHGVYPHHFLFYFVLFLSIFVGLNFGLVQRFAFLDSILLLSICAAIILTWQKQIPSLKEKVVDYSKIHQKIFQEIKTDPENNKNYRFGNADEVVAGWFNFEKAEPQTRDYYPFSPLYPDWQYFLEYTVWTKDENYNETNFLLDWYAVRNFYAGQPRRGVQRVVGGKFDKRTEYEASGSADYIYQDASPILSATNAPTMAVVADQASYNLLIRNLALYNLNSQVLLPVKVGERISDLERESLGQYDSVILYGFKGKVSPRTALSLNEYVSKGGRLLIEKGSETIRMESLPDPWPLERTSQESIGDDWRWEKKESGWRIDSEGGEWGAELGIDMKNWAKPLLYFQNQPAVISGQLGSGKVIWSGLNLPYHLSLSQSPQEREFFQNLLFSLLGEKRGPVDSRAHFINSQKREIEVKEKAKGVLFKESYFPNWKAYIQTTENGKQKTERLKVYPAGPMMMYAFLPKTDFPTKVVFFYQASLLEKLGLIISFLAWGGWLGMMLISIKRLLWKKVYGQE